MRWDEITSRKKPYILFIIIISQRQNLFVKFRLCTVIIIFTETLDVKTFIFVKRDYISLMFITVNKKILIYP